MVRKLNEFKRKDLIILQLKLIDGTVSSLLRVSFLGLLANGNLFQLLVLQTSLIFKNKNAVSIVIFCLINSWLFDVLYSL